MSLVNIGFKLNWQVDHMLQLFVHNNVTFWWFICKRDFKSSDLKGNMSHTPLTSGALARICQVAPKYFEKCFWNRNISMSTFKGRRCSWASAASSWPEGDHRQWPGKVNNYFEKLATSNSPDSFHSSHPQLPLHLILSFSAWKSLDASVKHFKLFQAQRI